MSIGIDRFGAESDAVLELESTGVERASVGAVLSRLEDRGLVRHRGRYTVGQNG